MEEFEIKDNACIYCGYSYTWEEDGHLNYYCGEGHSSLVINDVLSDTCKYFEETND
jgi:hypothetical protein